MNILIDIGHPAHVHLLRNLYFELLHRDYKVLVIVKDNLHAAKELLNFYKIPFFSIGSKSDNLLAKAFKQIAYDLKIAKIVFDNKIELGVGTSINLAHASKLTKMKSIVLDDDDDEVQPLFTKFAHPFCNTLLSPSALVGHRKKKDTVFYSGYHELAYLHPNKFSPNKDVISKAGLNEGDKYFVLRFNSFKAHHDVGIQGLSIENKHALIGILKPYGKIFITSERELEPEFEKYRIKIESHEIHSFLYYATMFIGDSQTMTSEAAVLATPAIRSNSFVGRISYLEEQEHKYGLTYGFKPNETEKMLNKIEELLKTSNLNEMWRDRRQKMLIDKIDVTEFLVWFVVNYPASFKVMKENPDYQYNFK
jgi:predicted glycosyltransferase